MRRRRNFPSRGNGIHSRWTERTLVWQGRTVWGGDWWVVSMEEEAGEIDGSLIALVHFQRHVLTLSQFSHSVMSNSLQPHGLHCNRPPCRSPPLRAYSNSCPLCQWCHPTISSSVVPLSSRLQSFPASGSFPVTQGLFLISLHQVAKLLEFQLQHQSFQWIFRTDFL